MFIALAFWTWLWGPMGALPVVAVADRGADPERASDAGRFAAVAGGLTERFRAKWNLPRQARAFCSGTELQSTGAFRCRVRTADTATRNLTDKATYERLEKDVTAVKNDIAALTDQITDALNSFAGTAGKQARRGYKQARADAESGDGRCVRARQRDDGRRPGRGVLDRGNAGRRHHAASAGDRRPRARPRLPDRR